MPYIGGTPEVQNFIKKYKASGHLVDPYTDQWHALALTRQELSDSYYGEFESNEFSEYDKKFGLDYRGHLLLLYLDKGNQNLFSDLQKIYLPIKSILGVDGKHEPRFILINLATQKILCIGLGRKNRSFEYDLDEYCSGAKSSIDSSDLKMNRNNENLYFKSFMALDYCNVTRTIIKGLHDVGYGLFEKASIPGNPDEWPEEANEDGLYLIDDEEFTENELESFKNSYEEADELMDEGLRSLKLFFPDLDLGDLNTGDY
jgi:hypothetical protein